MLSNTVGGYKRVHTYTKVNCPKLNVIARLYFELTYHDVPVKYVSNNTTGTSLEGEQFD